MALGDGSRASARTDRLRAPSRREDAGSRGRRRARAGRQASARSLTTGRGRVRVGNRVRTGERGAYPSVRVYLSPPNLTTSGNLLAGFLALLAATQGHAGWAAGLVLATAICDSLDGLVARRTHSESAFGSRLDSLADLASFGAAPALVLYVGRSTRSPSLGSELASRSCSAGPGASPASRWSRTGTTSSACRSHPRG
jgi:hypothetical protein